MAPGCRCAKRNWRDAQANSPTAPPKRARPTSAAFSPSTNGMKKAARCATTPQPPMSPPLLPSTSLAPCCGRRPFGAVFSWPSKSCCSSMGRPDWPTWDGSVFPPPSRSWTSITPWSMRARSWWRCWAAKSIRITRPGSDAGPKDCSKTRWKNSSPKRARNAPVQPKPKRWRRPWVTSSTMWTGCNMAPFAAKVSSSARGWSRPDARRSSEPAANSRACSGANQGPKTSWPCAVSIPADDSINSGKYGSRLTPPATMPCRWPRSRRILSYAQGALKELIDLPSVTQDGTLVKLCANIGKAADAAAARLFNADGVGLYRTEFAFLVQDHFPTEEEQYRVYRLAAEQMKGRDITIRLLDIGSDKLLPYFPLPVEANPSLGQRGIRLLLKHPEILKTQLRAILRLSATHAVSILLPMVGGVEDLLETRNAIASVKTLLTAEHKEFNRQSEEHTSELQ